MKFPGAISLLPPFPDATALKVFPNIDLHDLFVAACHFFTSIGISGKCREYKTSPHHHLFLTPPQSNDEMNSGQGIAVIQHMVSKEK